MNTNKIAAKLLDHFEDVTDPRRGACLYPLHNVLFITICAVIAGADDFVAIAKYGRTKHDWFAKFLDLSAGIPSHDRFNAILAMIKPAEFEQALLGWITSLQEITDGQVIAIDGKTLRGSYDKASGKSAIHMVSAWASANHISLGQVVVDAKSNEITAIPPRFRFEFGLELIEISGALVTIDAMGCQTDIAAKIVKGKGIYCLAVKKNQPTLYKGIEDFFEDHLADDFARVSARRHETREAGHGRKDVRRYFLCSVPRDLPDAGRWKNIKAIGIAINITELNDGTDRVAVRYYILNRYISGRRFAEAVRGHWGIENNLHWQLDVSFGEDGCRIRKGHADENFSTVRRTALSLLKRELTAKVGIKNKRLTAAWDEDYLAKVLFGQ